MSQSLEEQYEDLMSCSQIPGRGWLGAAYAVYNRMEKLEKEEEKKAKDKDESLLSGRHAGRAVQKELSQLFAGTALDPKEKIRRRVLRRAQRLALKKKIRRSSSSSSGGSRSSSSSSETEVELVEGVYAEETKARILAEKCPGALAMETLQTMRRNLLTTAGEEGDQKSTAPVALLYYRSVLGRKATGPQARELLTLATTVDALLKGKPATAVDILCQRMKSQEAVLGGTSWAIAQKIELASGETASLMARGELQVAQKESYLDSKAKWQSQASGVKGPAKGKGKGKPDKDGPSRDDRKDEPRRDKGKGGEKK